MPPRRKRPRSVVSPPSEKKPRGLGRAESLSYEQISWHVRIIDRKGPFGWEGAGTPKIWEIIKKLGDLEKLTWIEIFNSRNHHQIEKSKLCKEAKGRLIEIEQNDIDELVSLRLSGKERVWGIKDKNYLRVLWWDPKHKVCPVTK